MTDDNALPLDTQWTPAARDRLILTTEAICAAIREHTDFVLNLRGRDADYPALFEQADSLAEVAAEYDDALFDYTGVGAPYSLPSAEGAVLEESYEEGDFESGSVISVISRTDFRVVDPSAVLEAGRRAYLEVWPDKVAEDAEFSVTSVAHALYERMHAAGDDSAESSLLATPGLRPLAATRWFVEADEPLPVDPDDEGYPFERADGTPFAPQMRFDSVYFLDDDL